MLPSPQLAARALIIYSHAALRSGELPVDAADNKLPFASASARLAPLPQPAGSLSERSLPLGLRRKNAPFRAAFVPQSPHTAARPRRAETWMCLGARFRI